MSTGTDAHLGTWLAVGVLIGLALAVLLGVLFLGVRQVRRARPTRSRTAPPTPPEQPAADTARFADDDLPGFHERPPGSTAAAATGPSTDVAAGSGEADPDGPRPAATAGAQHGTADAGRLGAVAVAVVLLTAAVVVAVVGSRPGGPASAAATGDPTAAATADPSAATTPAPDAAGPPTASTADETPTDETPADETPAAGALAMTSVPLGEDGVAASVTFQGVLLEQRAVGLTVTYPSVSVSTDGRRSLAHVRLPTFNCLTAEPPADPVAAGCARSITEYADLAGPQLQVSRDGDRIELTGSFPTYTRPNGSAPGYTGRAYQLAAVIAPDGPEDGGSTPAAGTVRLGLDSAPTTADAGVNLLQLP